MTQVIQTGELCTPDWSASGIQRVVQNVRNLLGLIKYEVAYNRIIGMPADLIDLPAPELAARYAADAAELIEQNEPRASILSVEWQGVTADGVMDFKVVIDVVG